MAQAARLTSAQVLPGRRPGRSSTCWSWLLQVRALPPELSLPPGRPGDDGHRVKAGNGAVDMGARILRQSRALAVQLEPLFRREVAANVPGPVTSSRSSRGPVSQGDRPRSELVAIHELELDALAQTGEQRRPVSGKDRLHDELVLVDQSQICQR